MAETGERERERGRRARQASVRVETSAGGVVIRRLVREPEFLLIRDPYGNWGLPKGHLEPEETPQEAARREVAEETRIEDVRVLAELACIDWYFRDRRGLVHKFCHFFLMESAVGEASPRLEEGITDCVWLPYADAVRTITYDNAREVVRRAGDVLGLAEAGNRPA